MSKIQRPIIESSIYFISNSTHNNERLFLNPKFAVIIMDQMKHYSNKYDCRLHAFVIMPDHYHMLIDITHMNISKILHSIHSYSAHLMNKELGENRQIWSRNAWDEIIRNEDMYWQKLAYILLNPWRKGLVKDPLDIYLFSNIGSFITDKGESFLKELFCKYARYGE